LAETTMRAALALNPNFKGVEEARQALKSMQAGTAK
jgi:hypothetical protein